MYHINILINIFREAALPRDAPGEGAGHRCCHGAEDCSGAKGGVLLPLLA